MDAEFAITRLAGLEPAARRSLVERSAGVEAVADDVADILERVRRDGDAALVECAAEFDGVDLTADDLALDGVVARAADAVPPRVGTAIERAAANMRAFHGAQVPEDWRTEVDGRTLGRRFRPLERVGVYVPGGAAAYPSSALMGVIPAVVAGVEEVVVATPPAADPDPATLAAIDEAGADEVYAVGGAQAVGALAYGTETIDPVQKVVGPGNRYVAAAKAAIEGDVAIDFVAGPSEVLVLADGTASAEIVAADVLAQAEHDPDASVAVATDDAALAEAVADAVETGVSGRDRAETVAAAVSGSGSGVFLAESMDDAAAFAETYAPEHLSVQAADQAREEALADAVPSAGSVFLGRDTPVAAGDYATGTNHILPTGGGARAHGGVSVDTFLRASTVQRLDRTALADLRETVTTLAEAEGLEAHAASVDARFED
ncbi:MAG: histidinol dehydrogenase [Halobacteriaceae archaeon]